MKRKPYHATSTTGLALLVRSSGIRATQFAKRAKVSQAHLSAVMNGNTMPSPELLLRLCALLDVKPNDAPKLLSPIKNGELYSAMRAYTGV